MTCADQPDVFRSGPFRFFFFSREEPRLHIHVYGPDGEAKFRIEPRIELAQNYGLKPRDLIVVPDIIREREDDIRRAWRTHFGG